MVDKNTEHHKAKDKALCPSTQLFPPSWHKPLTILQCSQ